VVTQLADGVGAIDMSVYNRNRLFKLPLCCKPEPASQVMRLYRWPVGTPKPTKVEQLNAGMVVLSRATRDWIELSAMAVRHCSRGFAARRRAHQSNW